MFKFIEFLEKSINNISESELVREASKLPPVSRDSGELVGILPETLRRFWVYSCNLILDLDTKMSKVESKMKFTDEELRIFVSELKTTITKIENIRTFFWMAVHEEFSLNCTDKFYIGENWMVYYSKPICENCKTRHADNSNIPDVFKLLIMELEGMLIP